MVEAGRIDEVYGCGMFGSKSIQFDNPSLKGKSIVYRISFHGYSHFIIHTLVLSVPSSLEKTHY